MIYWLFYAVAMLLAVGGFIAALYAYSTIDDMIVDHLNPMTTCRLLNMAVPFDMGIQLTLTLMFFWQAYLFLWNAGLLFFNLWQMAGFVKESRMTGLAIYDPTRILRKDRTQWITNVAIGKCVYYSISLIIYLLFFIVEFTSSKSY